MSAAIRETRRVKMPCATRETSAGSAFSPDAGQQAPISERARIGQLKTLMLLAGVSFLNAAYAWHPPVYSVLRGLQAFDARRVRCSSTVIATFGERKSAISRANFLLFLCGL